MYSVGNVKRRVQKRLKNFLYQNKDDFNLIYVDESKLYFMQIARENGKNTLFKVKNLHCERKFTDENGAEDDELFYKQALYRFCREGEQKLPIYIFLSENLIWSKGYEFPQMPKKDLLKAIDWEIDDLKEKYIYGYRITDELEESIRLQLIFVQRDYLERWKAIFRKQNLTLAGFLACENLLAKSEKLFKVAIDEEFFDDDEEVNLIENILQCIESKSCLNLLAEEEQLPLFNWFKIKAVLLLVLLSFSFFIGGYMIVNHHNLMERKTVLQEQLNLLQEDIALMNESKVQQQQIKDKQEILKSLYEKSSVFYPLLLNLSATTLEKIRLESILVDDKSVHIKGKSMDYQAISQYKEQLGKIDWLQNIEMENASLSQSEELIDFDFKLKILE